jgi:hypothetical protein
MYVYEIKNHAYFTTVNFDPCILIMPLDVYTLDKGRLPILAVKG